MDEADDKVFNVDEADDKVFNVDEADDKVFNMDEADDYDKTLKPSGIGEVAVYKAPGKNKS